MNLQARATPRVQSMQVIPVAGHDSMLLNLCGAHAPYFTRNLVLLPTMPVTPASAKYRVAKASARRSPTGP